MARAGKNALVFLSATGISLSSQAMTAADNKTFQIAASSYQGEPFDPLGSLSITTSSGAAVSSTAYTLYRLNGTVVFPSSVGGRNFTGTVLPTAQVANAHGFSYSITADNPDVTVLGSCWRTRLQGIKDVTGEVQDYHDTANMANRVASSSQPVALTFYISSTASFDARCYGFLSADDISAAVDGVVDGTVSFEGSADLDGRLITLTTRGTSG